MRLGIGSYTYAWAAGVPGYPLPPRRLTPLDLLDKAANLGVHVVQFADNLPLERLTARELEAVANRAEQYEIEIELGAQGITPAYLRRHLRLAIRLGVSVLRLVLDTAKVHPTPEEVIERLSPLMPEFERIGIRLAIENHDRFKAATLSAILDRLNNPCAGVCLDTANSFGCLEGPETVLEMLGPRVFNLHVKDYVVRRLAHLNGFLIEGRPAGQGLLDIPHILRRLGELGRNPNAILELWPAPEVSIVKSVAKEARWAAESVHYLRQYIPD
jgi:3-oxoisoapionate decarboxylase